MTKAKKEELVEDGNNKLEKELAELKLQMANMILSQNNQKNQQLENKDKIPLDRMISCKSTVPGKLIYKSQRQNGYKVVWDGCGSVENVEYGELVSMRNIYPRFFNDAWIIPDSEEVMKKLNIEKNYKNIIDIDNMDSLFKKSNNEFEKTIKQLPAGFKDAIISRARYLLKEEKLDSVKKVKLLEKTFSVDLS